jgi:phenylalanine-4-hydroxylase
VIVAILPAMKKHVYVSRESDELGRVNYPNEDHETWSKLFHRQKEIIKTRACQEFIDGINLIGFTADKIPQHDEITKRLSSFHGWGVEQVPAIIPAQHFFTLLSEKKFPAASFIRIPEELDYIQEPDIFHEFFGHCPLLTIKPYADFMWEFGKMAIAARPKDRVQLFRLFWFTIEFGLIQTKNGVKAYGGGILSSKEETVYSVESDIPKRVKFDALEALRTPFRIDILQPQYFVIENFDQLFSILDTDPLKLLAKARELGDHLPLFPPKAETMKSFC